MIHVSTTTVKTGFDPKSAVITLEFTTSEPGTADDLHAATDLLEAALAAAMQLRPEEAAV